MNEKTKENLGEKIAAGELRGNLNKSEMTLLKKVMSKLKDTSAKNPHKKETIRDTITDLKANRKSTVSDNKMITRAAKGGMIKGYMGGGEVEVAMDDSPNSGMITTKGFGASRKT